MTIKASSLVQQLRFAAGYSVIQFAKKMGVSKQTIYNWESGLTTPDLNQVIRMYIVCGLNPKSLLPKRKKAVMMNLVIPIPTSNK
ncbi:helix-turn-helix transcriptional regulator [Pseudoalteromonas piscicida]|uniref:helix-turn-helix transcriptional regulator n=1 Tax=Pseudoalteromonas piscicida TaxID=43662 RepID=UPI0027E520C5|nr:helix-turn-helix transcriptional regulator [Pseudoalteromonas piscicida]WMO16183.1 helix-turn-helix domain-containing protein [Pseudoalteromonas piscicida]